MGVVHWYWLSQLLTTRFSSDLLERSCSPPPSSAPTERPLLSCLFILQWVLFFFLFSVLPYVLLVSAGWDHVVELQTEVQEEGGEGWVDGGGGGRIKERRWIC